MKIIIVGAGELGRLLARSLTTQNHNVVMIDSQFEELDRLGERLDILCVEGSCTSIATLKRAGVEDADALVAVSGDEAANILSCQIASRLGVEQTICRLFRSDSISEADGVLPDHFGIWRTFSAPEASVRKILGVLDNHCVLEKIRFGHPDACMAVVQIDSFSQMLGVRLRDIACGAIIDNIRIAAVLHGSQFLVPHGDTILGRGDKIYIAGRKEHVEDFIRWVAPGQEKRGRVLIAGTGVTGMLLAKQTFELGYDVRLLERNRHKAENVRSELPSGIMLLQGDPTDEELLAEAGGSTAEVFVSAEEDDENNILSCIIAKRLGARKVVALTHKPEYIRIVPTMDVIDCGFSASLISVNTILRLLGGGILRLDANLQNFGARLSEFKVTQKSPLAGKALKDCSLPAFAVLALVFRGDEVITPSGQTVLLPGDIAVSVVTNETAKRLSVLFPEDPVE